MSSKRRNALIAGLTGLIAAAIITAVAATTSHPEAAAFVAVTPALNGNGGGFYGQPVPGGGFRKQPGPGGGFSGPSAPGGGFGGPPAPGGGFNGQPRLGGGFRFGGFLGGLAAAATYLGFTPQKLQTEVMSGKTLAQVAKANGKSATGLVTAMLAAAKKQLDAAVSAGRVTKQQEDAIVSSMSMRLTAVVNGALPVWRGFGGGFGRGLGPGAGPGGNGTFGGGSGAGGGIPFGGPVIPA
jgi:hypothetical protein